MGFWVVAIAGVYLLGLIVLFVVWGLFVVRFVVDTFLMLVVVGMICGFG